MHKTLKFAHNIMERGGLMDEKFLFGVVLGMLGGAVLVTNSTKARQMVSKGQDTVVKTASKLGETKSKSKSSK